MPEDFSSAPDASTLTPYERRLWVELDRILYQNYLTPRTVTDFWKGDRDAVIAHLKQMKDRVIRSIVIVAYVELDGGPGGTTGRVQSTRRPTDLAVAIQHSTGGGHPARGWRTS
jgi:hypothetical protein